MQATIDPVVIVAIGSSAGDVRGGTRTDIDRLRAATAADAARRRAAWKPPMSNTAITRQFTTTPPSTTRPTPPQRVVAVRMPPPGRDTADPEVAVFWCAMQLLAEHSAHPTLIETATREVRATCAAARYARTTGVDDHLIAASLADVARMCEVLLDRRHTITHPGPIDHDDDTAENAVRLLASGLPSAARIALEGML
ncbi:hypothetical protein [Nocardia wallacei]|uniref:hypothetical protein n=1 Tax=Nocardia wallacei TaxID=480035 RepID=UPI0024584929|nr:hypothetical protein [Nocardia wallacei]